MELLLLLLLAWIQKTETNNLIITTWMSIDLYNRLILMMVKCLLLITLYNTLYDNLHRYTRLLLQ